jgi:hypothetical protein
MSFLSPWMLYGLAALAAPVILHLLKKRQVIKVPFGTLRFLKKAATRTRRSAQAENLLLLLLRCLVVALIVLAAAQPVTRRSFLFFGGDIPRTAIVIVDESMSMNYQAGSLTRLETARAQAAAIIDDLKSADRVAVIAASDRPRLLIAEPTVDHEAAREALKRIQPGFGNTNFAPALREAQKIAARESGTQRQIFLLTDSQDGGWRFPANTVFDDAWKSADIQFVLVRPDELVALNGSVGDVRIRPPYLLAGRQNFGEAVVTNHTDASQRGLLEVKVNDARVAEREMDLPAGGNARITFDFLPEPAAGKIVRGSVRKHPDHLPADDEAFFLLAVYAAPRTVIVDGADASVPEKFRPGYFLSKALAVGTAASDRVRTVTPDRLPETPLEGVAAVFLADVAELGDRSTVKLDRYLQGGGTVVMLCGDRTAAGPAPRWESLPAAGEGTVDLPAKRLRMQINDARHEFFAGQWGERKPFPAMAQKRLLKWKPRDGAAVLVSAGDAAEWPFLLERKIGHGRTVILNASADRSWGDFPLSPAFLPLLHQITLGAAASGWQAQNLLTGQPVPAPSTGPDAPKLWPVRFPGGDVREIPAGPTGLLLEHAEIPGVYEILGPDREIVRPFVVNPDPRESDLRPIPEKELSELVPHENVSGAENLSAWLAQRRGLTPLWPALLLLALAAFVGETAYANHLARKRSQGDAVKVRTGRKHRRWFGTFGGTQAATESHVPEEASA